MPHHESFPVARASRVWLASKLSPPTTVSGRKAGTQIQGEVCLHATWRWGRGLGSFQVPLSPWPPGQPRV